MLRVQLTVVPNTQPDDIQWPAVVRVMRLYVGVAADVAQLLHKAAISHCIADGYLRFALRPSGCRVLFRGCVVRGSVCLCYAVGLSSGHSVWVVGPPPVARLKTLFARRRATVTARTANLKLIYRHFFAAA